MGHAVGQGHLQVGHREAQWAFGQAIADALLNGWNPLLGDRAAHNPGLEHHT